MAEGLIPISPSKAKGVSPFRLVKPWLILSASVLLEPPLSVQSGGHEGVNPMHTHSHSVGVSNGLFDLHDLTLKP